MIRILKLFQFYSFFPFNFQCDDKIEITETDATIALTKLWLMIVILGLIINGYLGYKFQDEVFHQFDSVGYVNNVMNFIIALFTVFVSLIETHVLKNYQKSVWTKINIFNDKILHLRDEYKKFYKKFTLKFFCVYFIIAIIEIWTYWEIINSKFSQQWSKFWWLNFPISILTRSRHIFLVFYVDFLAVYLKTLLIELECVNESLGLLAKSKENNSSSGYKETIKRATKKLIFLKLMYGEIWYASTDISEAFGWSEALNFVHNFVQITCDSYWIYDSIKRGDYDNVIPTTLLLIPVILVLLVTIKSSADCTNLVR